MIAVPSDKLHKECIDHINTLVATSVERDEPERTVPCLMKKSRHLCAPGMRLSRPSGGWRSGIGNGIQLLYPLPV
ncbi:MAG: hypothetical protein EOM37_15575 [Proteobacteria bacterium]|nr:hypothetical protein [Pseudomonadota bacterium]